MAITVNTCPQCNALVMSDAAECHLCHYVFDQERTKRHVPPALPTDIAVADDLETCSKCGETYRSGLLRCSSCGAFTRDEIGQEYLKRQEAAGHRVPERFDLPEYDGAVRDSRAAHNAATGHDDDADGEFELTATDADFDFELAASVQLADDKSPAAKPVAPPVSAAPAAKESAAAKTPPTPTADAKPAVAAAEPAAVEKKADAADKSARTAAAPAEASVDALLKIAQEEEKDILKSRKSYRERVRSGFVVYCPKGCRIRVTERHRGRRGKCPRCGSPFLVPLKAAEKTSEAAAPVEGAAPASQAPDSFGQWQGWMNDLHCHAVVPTKLKIKPDSLLKDFQEVDVAFSSEGLLVLFLVKSGGLLGGGKKKPAARTAAQQHLAASSKLDGLPVASQRLYPAETLKQIAMAQPTPPEVESMFGGVPVFGTARIAVKLPKLGDETATQYLSFTLSQFREFARRLEAIGGPRQLGGNTEVPLEDVYNSGKCHFLDQPVQELIGVAYYQKDPAFALQLSGWRCEKCGQTISEDGRKKEQLGGANGKGIAKAKCPKCGEKMGHHPLYQLPAPAAAPAAPTA